jgi:Mn2+/Fe2+ NRAMP family transporter
MLNSAVVSAWLWVHVGVLLVVIGYAACGFALFPRVVESGRQRLETAPLRTLLIGLALSIPWVALAIGLANAPNGALKFAGVMLGLGWIAMALVGVTAIALTVGLRGEVEQARWTHVARGAGFVALTWMLPVLGWFVVLPLTLACGVGCLVGFRVDRRPASVPQAPPSAPGEG